MNGLSVNFRHPSSSFKRYSIITVVDESTVFPFFSVMYQTTLDGAIDLHPVDKHGFHAVHIIGICTDCAN